MSTESRSSYTHIFMYRLLPILIGLVMAGGACQTSNRSQTESYGEARQRMVETQIKARGIEDPSVIRAMLKVPREEFIPEQYRHYAYINSPVPIGHGQTISQPYIVALMTEELRLGSADKVLEIGTGSGYQAAVLSEIAKEVYTVEIVEALGLEAEKRLKDLGYTNVHVKIGDGFEGWAEYAPYDRIIVTCAPADIPEPLKLQLKVGGIMIIPIGSAGFQKLTRVKRYETGFRTEEIIPVSFVPLTGPHSK